MQVDEQNLENLPTFIPNKDNPQQQQTPKKKVNKSQKKQKHLPNKSPTNKHQYSQPQNHIKKLQFEELRLRGQQKLLYLRKSRQKQLTNQQLFSKYPYCNEQSYRFPMNQLLQLGVIVEDSMGVHWVQSAIDSEKQGKNKNKKINSELQNEVNSQRSSISLNLNGVGITISDNGDIFEGRYHNSEKCGIGYQLSGEGNVYLGEYLHGLKHGKGRYYWFNTNQSYNGEWMCGLPHGKGQYTSHNGDIYQGQFKNGVKFGDGGQKFHNGDEYNGQYVNGVPQGYGEYFWKDGSVYKGDFKNGCRHGYGIWKGVELIVDENNKGKQKNNKQGILNEQSYTGQYRLDQKQGFGIYQWTAYGQIYRGQFKQDFRCGYGEMISVQKNGQTKILYKGGWEKGKQKINRKIQPQVYEQFQKFIETQHIKATTKKRIGHQNCIPK